MSETPDTAAALKHCTATMQPEDWCAYMAKTCQGLETQRDEARAEVRLLRKAIADVLPGMKCQQPPKLGAWNWPWAVETLEEVLKDEVATRKSPLLTAPTIATNYTSPEIFEAHGREWYRHDGGPCPCDPAMRVNFITRLELKSESSDMVSDFQIASSLRWNHPGSIGDILYWRPADAPEKLSR